MEFRVLGPLEVSHEGKQVQLGSRKQRAVLAILLLRANQPVSPDVLIDELWGERPPPSAAHTLQAYVSRLRPSFRAAGVEDDRLVTRAAGYVLRVEFGELDLHRVEQLAEDGRRALSAGSPERATAKLSEALSLCSGPPLADLAFDGFARVDAEQLDERRLAVLEDRIEADLAMGKHDLLVAELERLVARHPLRERLRGQLMLALYRGGRQADALKVYRDARDYFVGELGLEPSKPLRELEHSVLRQDDALDLAPAADPPVEVSERQEPAPEPHSRSVLRQTGRRLVLVSLVSVLLLAAAAVASMPIVGSDDSPQLEAVVPNSVAVIDPHTNGVLGGIRVGYSPSTVAFGESAVWVLNGDDGTVSRIDPISKETVRTVAVGGQPSDLAAGAGAVWTVNSANNTVTRIDSQANVVGETIRLPTWGERPPVSFGSGAHIAVGGGSVWVTRLLQHGFVWRIDPKTNAIAATIRLARGAGGDALAVGDDAVWVNGNGGVMRIDTTTYEKTLLNAADSGGIGDIAVSKGAVWVAGITSGPARDSLWRIDPVGEYATASTAIGAGPAGVAVDGRAIWAVSSVARTISRVDPTTNRVVTTIPIDGTPHDVTTGAGAVWVTVR